MIYNGIEYRTRCFLVTSEETGEMGIQIAPESLGSELINEDGEPVNAEAEDLDSHFYHYVPDAVIDGDPVTICENHLDTKFTFIEDLEA